MSGDVQWEGCELEDEIRDVDRCGLGEAVEVAGYSGEEGDEEGEAEKVLLISLGKDNEARCRIILLASYFRSERRWIQDKFP
jgi:hypothetical protein